jgi:hypothetical protein
MQAASVLPWKSSTSKLWQYKTSKWSISCHHDAIFQQLTANTNAQATGQTIKNSSTTDSKTKEQAFSNSQASIISVHVEDTIFKQASLVQYWTMNIHFYRSRNVQCERDEWYERLLLSRVHITRTKGIGHLFKTGFSPPVTGTFQHITPTTNQFTSHLYQNIPLQLLFQWTWYY